MSPYYILLADDHTLVRQGLRRILEEDGDLKVVAEAANGQEALDLLENAPPDLAVLDIQMPRMSGLEAAKSIKTRHPEVKILILTMHKEKAYLHQAQEIGVEGFVLKEDVDEVLLLAIAAIRRGQTFVSPLIGG